MSTLAASRSRVARPDALLEAADWVPGTPPVSVPLDGIHAHCWRGVRCVQIDVGADPEQIHGALRAALDEPPTFAQVADLVDPDPHPKIDFGESEIRHSSAFDVVAHRPPASDDSEPCTGLLTYRLVEFLSGPGWLVTCWHEPKSYCGTDPCQESKPPAHDREAIWRAVARRWPDSSGRTSGDLGVLVLSELVLTYAPASRELATWLENWELAAYSRSDGELNTATLDDIRGAVTLFRKRLTPLNPAGVKSDLHKAWFAGVTCAGEVAAVDERVDRALARLAGISRSVRDAFAFVHDERQRQCSDRLERIAIVALVPTFIASFYGANTALPGGGTWRGFDSMVIAMVALTLVGLLGVSWAQRERKRRGRH